MDDSTKFSNFNQDFINDSEGLCTKNCFNGHDNRGFEDSEADKKRIAVIGGGIAGIESIISLKAEGFEPVCFEARDAPGGTWYYSEESVEGYASTMATTYLNNSKELSAFSNFPPRKEFNICMRHSEAYQYYMEYCKRFDGERHIRCNTEVISVNKTEDYEETGRFVVTVRDKRSDKVSSDVYDGVMVCTGHFNRPKVVHFPGQEIFKGKIIHTHSLKRTDSFQGQNVLIIGNGCSGLDAADLISTVAKQVYISTRSGMFVISRLGPRGYPIDHVWARRYLNVIKQILPANLVSWYLETFYLDVKFDHRLYNIEPKYHVLSKDPILNDVIFSKLLSGAVALKGQIKFFTENGVVFDEEEKVTKIDSVVLATGYKCSYPFLEKGLFETENGRFNLYKCMYPVQLPHPTLVFIGLFNDFGPGVPLGEIQSRWAAHIFAGKGNIPTQKKMLKDAIKRHQENTKLYTPSEYMSVRVDHIQYFDEIASQFGVKPNLFKYFFTDFLLFIHLVFGPFLPYQYRLQGPHKWNGAREAIMSSNERLLWPLTHGKRANRTIFEKICEWLVNLFPRDLFL